jgi:hypothetical protein
MRQKYPAAVSATQGEDDDNDDDDDDIPQGGEADTVSTSTVASGSTVDTQKKRRKKSQDDPEYIVAMKDALKRSSDLHETVTRQIAGGDDDRSRERRSWGAWMASSMQQIDDTLWTRWVQIAFCFIVHSTVYMT